MSEEESADLVHPALRGREEELGSFSTAVRRLIELSVTTAADGPLLKAVAASLDGLSDRLAAVLPKEPFVRFLGRDTGTPPDVKVLEQSMPFDVVVGRYNPLALPVKLEMDPPLARATALFTTPYEGAPGCVHGASIASAFDLVLTAANLAVGAAGPTVRLELRFRRPTLISVRCDFEAEVTERTERRVFNVGRLLQNGEVTVEAKGEFATLDMAAIRGLRDRSK
jgi:acyl-coenzyme A thioesterase PaaI-like protein